MNNYIMLGLPGPSKLAATGDPGEPDLPAGIYTCVYRTAKLPFASLGFDDLGRTNVFHPMLPMREHQLVPVDPRSSVPNLGEPHPVGWVLETDHPDGLVVGAWDDIAENIYRPAFFRRFRNQCMSTGADGYCAARFAAVTAPLLASAGPSTFNAAAVQAEIAEMRMLERLLARNHADWVPKGPSTAMGIAFGSA